MAYDFLGLVNDVNRRLNEVELTSTNFAGATGFYSFAKDAVNASIRHIQQEEYEWPWNHVERTDTLLAQTNRYVYPYDAKTVNFNSFRLKRNDTLGNGTAKLIEISYEEYIEKYVDVEYNTDATGMPTHIARTPSREYVLYPNPDKAYELVYEYYTTTFDLVLHTDVPNIPEVYKYVVVDGAMYYAYQFRGDYQATNLALEKFRDGIKYLRSLYINRTPNLRDTRRKF